MRAHALALRSLVLALATAGAGGCSSATLTDATSEEDNPATIGENLRIGRSTQINKVSYTLTGPSGFSRTSTVDASKWWELVDIVIPNVPVGGPYSLAATAKSTDGNVTCTGSKTGITESCPKKQVIVKLSCARNHLGREWGDRDWRSNGRTFYLATDFDLKCTVSDGGAVSEGGAVSDAGGVSDAGVEACTPATVCPAGACGDIDDNCGGVLHCGTTACAAGQECGPNHLCVCPIPVCAVGQNCGTITNACGSTVDCGVCVPPAMCGANGTPNLCSIVENLCDINTAECLVSHDRSPGSCYQCAVDLGCFDPSFGGHTCEELAGVHGANPATCSGVFGLPNGVDEEVICFTTLRNIFLSHCAADQRIITCLCGTTAPDACLNGTATPTGAVYPLYQCDLGPTIGQINNNILSPLLGAGVANSIIQCLQAFNCDCAY